MRTLDTARRLEALALLIVSPMVAFLFQPLGVLPSLLLLVVAVVMVPRDRTVEVVTRERRRAETLDSLLNEAMQLRGSYMHVRSQPLTQERSQSMWRARREILVWIDNSGRRLHRFPEVAGILEHRRGRGGLIDELDRCIGGLSEVKRLGRLSEKLGLPF
jgi:hypothetical protein